MSAATHNNYAPGFPPSSARVEPPADCATARAGGHLAPGACAPAAPGVLSRRRWTDADNHRLRALRADGLTDKEIAREMGRTLNAVESHTKRLENKGERGRRGQQYAPIDAFNAGKPVTPAVLERIMAMRDAGKTWRQVAIAEGRTMEAVRLIRIKYELVSRFKWTPKNTARMIVLLRDGASKRAAARAIKCCESAVRARIKWIEQHHPHLLRTGAV